MFFWIFAFFISLVQIYASQENLVILHYNDLPKMLLEKNKLIKGQKLLTESRKLKENHLARSFFPMANLELGEELFQIENLSSRTQSFLKVEAKVNLYRGNRDQLEDKIIHNQIIQSQLDQEDIFAKELREVRKLYWEIVYTMELIQLLAKELGKNKKNLQMGRHRVQRGLGPKVDLLEFEMREAEIYEEIESLKHEKQFLQIQFTGFFDIDSNTNFQTDDSIPHIHDEELLTKEINSANYREVQSVINQQEFMQIQKLQTQKWWIPVLDLYSGYYIHNAREKNFEKISDRDEIVAGLKLSFDLYDSGESRIKSLALQLQSDATKLKADQLNSKINVQIEAAKEELKHGHELIHSMEHRIDKWEYVFNKILEEYNLGVKTSLDVLDASERYLNLQKEYALRRKNYQMAKIILLSFMGE